MKKVLYFISFIVLLLTSCTSKENKADALIKARGFECANVEKLEEFQCNPASAEMIMVAYICGATTRCLGICVCLVVISIMFIMRYKDKSKMQKICWKNLMRLA